MQLDVQPDLARDLVALHVVQHAAAVHLEAHRDAAGAVHLQARRRGWVGLQKHTNTHSLQNAIKRAEDWV